VTQGERARRRDRKRSEAPRDTTSDSQRVRRSENRLLLAVLIVLVAVLIALVVVLLEEQDAPPADPSAGPTPKPLLAIPGPGKGDAPEFLRPLAAAWAPNGDIYVSDTGNGRVCVFTGAGRFLREFGRANLKDRDSVSVLQQPAGLAVGPDGNVYVADVHAGAVAVFTNRGKLVKRIRPTARGRLRRRQWAPTDVALSDDRIYVTDATGVSVFSADGTLLSRIDEAGGKALSYPNGVAVQQGATIVVSDTNNGRIVSMEESGTVLWITGPSDAQRRLVGLPRGIAVARSGSILVADAFLFGITALSEKGVYGERYGGRGNGPGSFEFPNDVDVRGDLVIVADKQNNRVQMIRWPGLLGVGQ
jgi:DNA-binding beta-propeller fold protein YncE